jgi:hypothetical protein
MTQQNSNEERGSIIPSGDTLRHYNRMLQQAFIQTQELARKARISIDAARANSRKREIAFWSWNAQRNIAAIAEKPAVSIKEVSPATLYLAAIERAETVQIAPVSPQDTDPIEDISLKKTIIRENWNPYAMLKEMLEQKEMSTTNPTLPRITKDLYRYYVEYTSTSSTPNTAIRDLIDTGVELYVHNQQCNPLLIEVSTDTYHVLPLACDWKERGHPGLQQPCIPISIVPNQQLKVGTVRCWGN